MALQQIINQTQDHLRGAWRFRWIALAVAVAICGVGWAAIFTLPDRYGATAKVYVDMRTALSEVTKGIGVQVSVETQIDRVTEQMLGAPLLQTVGDETDLFRGVSTPREKQERIAALRKQIKIKGAANASGTFTIDYENPSRDMAIRVVDKLLNTFIESTKGGKQSGSKKAQDFLDEQSLDLGKQLSEQETAVAEFKKKYFGVMPAAQGDYFTRLQAETAAVKSLEGQLETATQERNTLKAQLSGTQQYVPRERSGGSDSSTSTPTSVLLRDAELKLDELRLKFTEKHPDVDTQRSLVTNLKQRLADENAAAKNGDSAAVTGVGMAESAVYSQIRMDLNKKEVQITSLQTELDAHRKEAKRLAGQMDMSADVEAQYTKLTRDYESTKKQYQDLRERGQQTHLGDEAEQTGMVQFTIIEPPMASFDPVAPKRALLIAIVLIAGLGAGGGIAYLLHLLKPVFYTSHALGAATGLPVIGVVPFTWLDRHRQAFRREVLKYSGVVVGLALFAVLIISQQARLTALAKGFL